MDNLETRTPDDEVNTFYFGPAWTRRLFTNSRRVPTPLGEECSYCDEPIIENDRGLIGAILRMDAYGEPAADIMPIHAECDAYPYIGHAMEVCHCTGYDTTRASALLAWQRAKLDGRWH